MNRRTFHRVAAAALGGAALRAATGTHYAATWESIRTHKVPEWYNDAKLGIFIHWGLYSVPAWAPPTGELGSVDRATWFRNNPYAEWYLNSLRLKDSPTYKHHLETYGANFDYYSFAPMFEKENSHWNPDEWGRLFQRTGARYVVLTTKHHDGFRLWPSRVENPKRPSASITSKRDLVGDLTKAVRGHGLKMGLYYSGGLDWTFESRPIATGADMALTAPKSEEYGRYADAHWRELIERYDPAVLWNDITYPKTGKPAEIFSEYYNRIPEGVVDDRFGVDFADFTTPEYSHYDRITPKKWESCRGLGFSFGYNRVEGPKEVIESGKLVALLVDIVSKNGNLLLNIGPRADGSISDIQLDRLHALGRWLGVNGEGIFGTRPWTHASAKTPDGIDVRFTRKGDDLYAFLLAKPAGGQVAIPSLHPPAGAKVSLLGGSAPLEWSQAGGNCVVRTGSLTGDYAWGLKIHPAPQGA